MIIMCPDCGGNSFKIDIEDRGKKRVVTMICKTEKCGFIKTYIVKGEEIPKGGR